MKNYYAMACLFIMMLLALQLSGYTSAILAFIGVIIASPSIQISQSRHRWLAILFLFSLCLFFYPSLDGLKELPLNATKE